jgi:hypothetical protein
LLAVRLRREEDVDAELQPRRLVDHLGAAAGHPQALDDGADRERMHDGGFSQRKP